MRKAKSIDQLYEEARDFDLVLTNDAPLATALNARLDRPRLGPWAITPQQLARRESIRSIGGPVWDDLSILSRVSRETGIDIRQVHGEVEEMRRMRRHSGRMDELLRRRVAKRIWDSYIQTPCLERAMVSFDTSFFDGKKVVVIGLDAFNDLDKHLLPPPDRFRELRSFVRGGYSIEQIMEMGSDRAIARHVVDLIDESNMEDVAIILNPKEPIADAVRSALYRRGLPFVNSIELRDLPGLRDLLDLLELALPGRRSRMRELRPLLRRMGHFVDERWDSLPLEEWAETETGELRRLGELLIGKDEGSFGLYLQILVSDADRWPVARFLERLGMIEARVDRESLDLFRFALDNIDAGELDIPLPKDEREGVVLVDCMNSTYVDRSLVFYLGMGQDWYPSIFREEYMDAEAEIEKETFRFQILLQQGKQRLHMVKASHRGKEVTPCLLFSHALGGDRMISSFPELCPSGYGPGEWLPEPEPPARASLSLPEESEMTSISPSSLNRYLTCPKKYMLSRMAPTPDSPQTLFGSLVHSYAQLRASYADKVSELGMEQLQKDFMSLYLHMVEEGREELDSSRVRLALERVNAFFDENPCEDSPLVPWDESLPPLIPGGRPRRAQNPFFALYELEDKRACSEVSLDSPHSPLRGKMDLLLAPGRGVDFKTGSGKNSKEIAQDADPERRPMYLDVQAPAYLEILSESGAKEAELSFVYLLSRPPEAHLPDAVSDELARIRYTGMSRHDLVRSGRLVELLPERYGCMGCSKVLKKDFAGLQEALMELRVWERGPDWHLDPDVIARMHETFQENSKGDLAKTLKCCRDILHGIIVDDGDVILLKEDLEDMAALAQEVLEEIASCRVEGFPALPLNPKHCRSACDLAPLCLEEGADD